MGKLRPFVRKDSYMPNKKWIPFVIGNGYTTTDGASGPAPEYETVTGNPVSFNAITPFPLRKLEVAFSPVQNLNGYDAPWPAGGGVQMFNYATVSVSGNTVFFGDGITLTEGQAYTISYKGTANARMIVYTHGTSTALYTSGYTKSYTITPEADATVDIRFYNSDGLTAGETLFMMNKGSTALPYAPYSNECPISGWDSLTVEQRGKNLFDESSLTTTGITYSDGVLTGTAAAFNNAYGTGGTPIPISVGASRLTISLEAYTDGNVGTTGGGILFKFVHEDGTSTQAQLPNSTSEYAPLKVTSANGKTVVGIVISFGSNGSNIWHIRNLQLELGSTASSYQSYNPLSRSISISLGSTVYSGYVDVVTGVGEITHKGVDMGSLSWRWSSSYDLLYAVLDGFTVNNNASTAPNAICSTYQSKGFTALGDGIGMTGWKNFGEHEICVRDADYAASADAFKTAMSGQTIVYELATPIPIQLTPQEVNSLAGDNTMWSDANGDLTITYRSN